MVKKAAHLGILVIAISWNFELYKVPVLCSPAVAAMPVRRCAPAERGTIQWWEGICAPRCQC